jgi:hypothetical protein
VGVESTYRVSYRCPHCQAALQGQADRPDPWLRCPRCGRASQPTRLEHVASPRPPETPAAREDGVAPAPSSLPANEPSPVELVAVTHRAPASPGPRPLSAILARRDEAAATRDWRILYGSGLFVAVTMLVFSALDRSVTGASIFSALAFFCLVLLVLPGRPGR